MRSGAGVVLALPLLADGGGRNSWSLRRNDYRRHTRQSPTLRRPVATRPQFVPSLTRVTALQLPWCRSAVPVALPYLVRGILLPEPYPLASGLDERSSTKGAIPAHPQLVSTRLIECLHSAAVAECKSLSGWCRGPRPAISGMESGEPPRYSSPIPTASAKKDAGNVDRIKAMRHGERPIWHDGRQKRSAHLRGAGSN